MGVSIRKRVGITVEAEHRDGQGNLIARSVSIQEPDAPRCMKPKCLWYFFTQIMFSGLLSTYHRKRVEYAETRRHKTIPMKYRTGEEAPRNMKQAIWGIIKLSIRR